MPHIYQIILWDNNGHRHKIPVIGSFKKKMAVKPNWQHIIMAYRS